jgi:hypothetical protein
MITLFILESITVFSPDYTIQLIGSNQTNQDRLFAVDGDLTAFKTDYPQAKDYYDGDWFLNFYPDAVGDTPLEKYLNAINGVTMSSPPKWNNILPALASSSLFLKILTTQNPNAFSALQTVVQYRNIELFQVLAKATLEAIPGGLTEAESQELNTILIQNNFPLIK